MAKRTAKKKADAINPNRKAIGVGTSDNHLKPKGWVNLPGLEIDSFYSFQQITTAARKLGLPSLWAGDLLDKKANYATIAGAIRREMDAQRDAGLPVYVIQGQHEKQPKPWFLELSDWPVWVHDEMYQLIAGSDLTVRGLDFTAIGDLPAALARLDEQCEQQKPNILMMHQVTTDFMGGQATCEMSLSQVPRCDLLIIGDYHQVKYEQFVNRHGEMCTVLSPGSTCQQSINESPKKFYHIIYDDYSVEHIPLLTREVVIPPELWNDADFDKFLQQVGTKIEEVYERCTQAGMPEELHKPLLWCRYNREIPDAAVRLDRAVNQRAYIFRKALREETVAVKKEREARVAISQHGLLGCLPLVVDPEENPLLYSDCHQVLSAALAGTPPREAIDELRKSAGLT